MIPSGTRVFFSVEPADLRRSFDGLAAAAMDKLKRDPREGGMFVFLNRRCTQVRVLFKDPHGWCILAKRLDQGRFRRPRVDAGRFCWETEAQTLLRFLDDVEFPLQRRTRNPSGRSMSLALVQL